MAELGKAQGDTKGRHAAEAEQVWKGRQEALPITHHQENTQQQYGWQTEAQQARPKMFQPGPSAIEESIWPPQRNTEKQIFVQELSPQALALTGRLARITGTLLSVTGADQVMHTQKMQQLFNRLRPHRRTGFGVGRIEHPCRVAQRPMAQQPHGRCAQLEILATQWVGQGPLRRTIEPRRAR